MHRLIQSHLENTMEYVTSKPAEETQYCFIQGSDATKCQLGTLPTPNAIFISVAVLIVAVTSSLGCYTFCPNLGWEIRSELHGIPRLFQFRTFWTPKFSSEFYFSDCKMCSRQFWTRFFRFRILSCHQLFQFHESENVPAINVSGEWHQILIYSMHQLFSSTPLPSHCSWYLLDTHKS